MCLVSQTSRLNYRPLSRVNSKLKVREWEVEQSANDCKKYFQICAYLTMPKIAKCMGETFLLHALKKQFINNKKEKVFIMNVKLNKYY